MRFRILVCLSLAACAAPPSEATRASAIHEAATAYAIPEPWLLAIAYERGRFELAGTVATVDAPAESDDGDALAADTEVDETDGTLDDAAAVGGADVDDTNAHGLMYLTDAQIARASELTGDAPADIENRLDANAAAAAALLADARDDTDLRTATVSLLGLDGDADAAGFALDDLDATIADGFDLTTSDGEHLTLAADPGPHAIALEALPVPGKYPKRQWIASPNHSSRLGYAIRYVVVHDIEGTMAGAIHVFKSSASQASAHYIVRARDGHIVQMVHEGDNAWHAGHGWFNRHSIGIEHEGFAHRAKGGGYYVDTQYRASAALTCAIAVKHHIPVDRKHIFGHGNIPSNLASHRLCSDARAAAGACGGVSHHSDPGRHWKWHHYMKLVRACVAAS